MFGNQQVSTVFGTHFTDSVKDYAHKGTLIKLMHIKDM